MTGDSILRNVGAGLASWFGHRAGARVYCTYFDSAYLARGIAMLRSLRRQDPSSRILVLALDRLCARVLRRTFRGDVQVLEADVLHEAVPQLTAVCRHRSLWAYYATQKPALALYAMESRPRPGAVIHIDADTWFFGDPAAMLEELGGASIGLSPHRFPAALQHLKKYGLYNAGWIYWRNDDTGRRCLADWRDDCLAWCEESAEADGRFMNQGYLNSWPERYSGVQAVGHPGANLAPWNVDSHVLAKDGARVTVDGRALVYYHFSGLSRDAEGRWLSHYDFDRQLDFLREWIYRPYIRAVNEESGKLKEAYGIDGMGSVRSVEGWPVAFQFDLGGCAGRSQQRKGADSEK